MIQSGQIAVGLTAQMIDGTSNTPFALTLYNMTNQDNIYLGGADVTITTGLEMHPHTYLTLTLPPGAQLYAVSAIAGETLGWLKVAL